MNPFITKSVLAAATCAGFLTCAAAPAIAAPDAQGRAESSISHSTGVVKSEQVILKDLNNHDGVKGKLKNFAPYPVVVTNWYDQKEYRLESKQELTYYSGAHSAAMLTMQRADGSAPSKNQKVRLQITDCVGNKPVTTFTPDTSKSSSHDRTNWQEQESHTLIWGDTSLRVKREIDGWNGGHETWYTSDWAVFTVHIDGLEK